MGRGWVLVRVRAAAKGAAEEAEDQEVSRQEQYRGRAKPNVARTARHHTPGEAGLGENEAGSEAMAGSRRLGLWDMQSCPPPGLGGDALWELCHVTCFLSSL